MRRRRKFTSTSAQLKNPLTFAASRAGKKELKSFSILRHPQNASERMYLTCGGRVARGEEKNVTRSFSRPISVLNLRIRDSMGYNHHKKMYGQPVFMSERSVKITPISCIYPTIWSFFHRVGVSREGLIRDEQVQKTLKRTRIPRKDEVHYLRLCFCAWAAVLQLQSVLLLKLRSCSFRVYYYWMNFCSWWVTQSAKPEPLAPA